MKTDQRLLYPILFVKSKLMASPSAILLSCESSKVDALIARTIR
jgi:hypothetical protein